MIEEKKDLVDKLVNFIDRGDISSLKKLVSKGLLPEMNSLEVEGFNSLVVYAMHYKKENLAIEMIKLGFDVYPNEDNYTLAHFAVQTNCTKVLQELAKNEELINKGSSLGLTPLHASVLLNKYKSFCVLIEKYGVDLNAQDNFGNTPCHYIVQENREMMAYEMQMKLYVDHLIKNNDGVLACEIDVAPDSENAKKLIYVKKCEQLAMKTFNIRMKTAEDYEKEAEQKKKGRRV